LGTYATSYGKIGTFCCLNIETGVASGQNAMSQRRMPHELGNQVSGECSMTTIRPLTRCLAAAFGGSLVIASAAVYAQQQPAAPAQKQERIEVTGSNIKRIDSETASPVQVITRKDIERAGVSTLNDVLQNISGAGSGLDDRFTNGFAPGAGAVNLRGLGFNSTLVLVNGRRLPTYPFAQQVGTAQGFQDLQNIPLTAVERVEVLKDGASAIYGADAVGGVINIILRRDYVGLEVGAEYGQSSKGDGKSVGANVAYGVGSLASDRFNFLATLNYYKQDEVLSRDREFAKTEDLRPRGGRDRRSAYGYPGTFFNTDTGDSLLGPGCGPSSQFGGSSDRGGICRYDRAELGSLLPGNERVGLSARLSVAITPDITGFAEALYLRNEFQSVGWPAGTTDDVGIGSAFLPPDNPTNPFPGSFTEVLYRFADVGNRGNVGKSDTTRLVLGVKGSSFGWDWEAAANANRIKIDNTATNNALNSRVMCLTNPAAAAAYAAGGDPLGFGTLDQIFAANPSYAQYFRQELAKCASAFSRFGYYNYLNPASNAAGVADYLRHDAKREGKSSLNGFDIRASRELMQLGAGPLAVAVGLEQRKESADDIPDLQLQTGDTLAISAAQAFGERKVTAVFTELSATPLRGLELSAAVRHDKYTGNGKYSSTSPKLGVRYQPNKNVLLRGTVSDAFRAPSIFETTPAQQTSFTFGIEDPVLCPSDPNQCTIDIRRVQQGNPNLKPEESRAKTLGVVLEPTDNFGVSVDLWAIKRKNEIGSFGDQQLINLFPTDPNIVVRGPDGTIRQINQVPVQLNSTETKGVDLEFRVRADLGGAGKLTAKLGGTYVTKYDFSTVGDSLNEQITTNTNGSYSFPRWRSNWDLALNRGPWEFSLNGYAVAGYAGLGTTVKVATYDVMNAGVSYSGIKNLTLRLQVNNVFDRVPSYNDESNGAQAGYNVTLTDPMGRYFRIGAQYKFW
jgi:iron complex outermembrane receptor protein